MRNLTLCVSVGVAFTWGASASAIQITVLPSLSPRVEPSLSAYTSNAIHAIQNGLSQYGDSGQPSFYKVITQPMPVRSNVISFFNSWKGRVDPGSYYGPAFANEMGTWLRFGFHIAGGGTQFSISQLSLHVNISEPHFNNFSFAQGLYNYDASLVGLNYGPDGIKGTADDIWITGGSNTQLVHEAFGRGSGIAWLANSPGFTPQEQMDMLLAQLRSHSYLATYTLHHQTGDFTGSAGVRAVVPGPAAALPFLLGWLKLRRRGVAKSAS
jgi:hypothetical protein